MKLSGKNNSSIELKVLGYEFPDLENEDYDSNWLNICISVNHKLGAWKSTDPSLLTYELEELGIWLEHISDNPETSTELSFIEPNLFFKYIATQLEGKLQIYFELESRPTWVETDGAGMDDLWIEIPFDLTVFKSASESISQYCNDFPQRTEV